MDRETMLALERASAEKHGITEGDVKGWFQQAAANWQVPPDQAIRSLTYMLNVMTVDHTPPEPAIDLKPIMLKLKRIRDAITTLQAELPSLIEANAGKLPRLPVWVPEEVVSQITARDVILRNLLTATRAAVPEFHWPQPRRRQAQWAPAAQTICVMVSGIWRQYRRRPLGLNPDSPVVVFVGLALARIDKPQTLAAISQCLRRARQSGALRFLTPDARGDN